MSRPFGVILLGLLATLVGIMYIFAGFRLTTWVTFGPAEIGDGVWFSGLLTIIVGVIWLAVGGALFSLQAWGLLFCEIMAIFGLINAVFVLLSGGSQANWGLFVMPLLILWYCNRPTIKQAFVDAGVQAV